MKTTFRNHVAAAMLLLPVAAAFVAAPVAAQSRNDLTIYTVVVKGSGGLREGEMLFLSAVGTPGARNAYVTLGGGIRVTLTETSPGTYSGQHVIARGDRIETRQAIVARLEWDNGSRTRNGSFPSEFQALSRSGMPAGQPDEGRRPNQSRDNRPAVSAPRIQRFAVAPSNRVSEGSTLRFTVTGNARANTSVDIPGIVNDLPLRETRSGTYEGSYTVRRSDDLRSFDKAVATLRLGDQRTTSQLELRAAETRPVRNDRPDAGTRPGRDERPDGATRPNRENRPAGEFRPGGENRTGNRDAVGNRDGRNPQAAP